MAGYSYLTGSVSASPPGRAVALFQHGFGVEFLDFPQAIVVGADGDVYRRLDEAEHRGGSESQGDPAPMLLSPQGTHVAVGDHDTGGADLAVVDLRTGDSTLYPLPAGRSIVPLAWSPDGKQVAYQFSAEPTNPYGGFPITGDVGLLDPQTGIAEALPGASNVKTAAFSPDGTELALQHGLLGGTLEVVSLVGDSPRVVQAPGGELDGPAAWSPDGLLLATTEVDTCRYPELGRPCVGDRTEISFADATGQGRRVPDPLQVDAAGSNQVLGWTASNEVAVLTESKLTDTDPDPGTYWVTVVPLGGGDPRNLSAHTGKQQLWGWSISAGLGTSPRPRCTRRIGHRPRPVAATSARGDCAAYRHSDCCHGQGRSESTTALRTCLQPHIEAAAAPGPGPPPPGDAASRSGSGKLG